LKGTDAVLGFVPSIFGWLGDLANCICTPSPTLIEELVWFC
jgi:hypothetical protein